MNKEYYLVAAVVGLFLAMIFYSVGYFDDVFAEKPSKTETEHYIEEILRTEDFSVEDLEILNQDVEFKDTRSHYSCQMKAKVQ